MQVGEDGEEFGLREMEGMELQLRGLEVFRCCREFRLRSAVDGGGYGVWVQEQLRVAVLDVGFFREINSEMVCEKQVGTGTVEKRDVRALFVELKEDGGLAVEDRDSKRGSSAIGDGRDGKFT